MIIRRQITNNFTIVPNEAILDTRLSISARWLLIYLLSRPNDWEVRINDIQKQADIGRDKAYGMIKELIAIGWVRKDEFRQKEGRWGGVEYVVMDQPGEPASDPLPENPDAVEPVAENQHPTKNEETPKTESTNLSSDDALAEEFEEFWAAYPKRQNNPKAPAKAKYLNARRRLLVSRLTLVNAAKAYARSRENEDPKFTKMAATWLNQRCWEEWAQAEPEIALKPVVTQKISNEDMDRLVEAFHYEPNAVRVRVAEAIFHQKAANQLEDIIEAAQKYHMLIKRQREEGFEVTPVSMEAFIKFKWRDMDRYEFCRVGQLMRLSVRLKREYAE